MASVDRDRFLEEGYLVVKEAVPRDKLEQVRAAYETLVDRQREIWKAERAPDEPPGGQWEVARQPRLNLSTPSLVQRLDPETAPAVEVWLEENIRGVSAALLDEPTAAVTQMMMMCSPAAGRHWHEARVFLTLVRSIAISIS